MPRDRFFMFSVGPDIMPLPMPQEPPTQVSQAPFEIAALYVKSVHRFVYKYFGTG